MSRIPEPIQTPEGPAYEGRLLDRADEEVVDQGAPFDMRTLLTRRNVLGVGVLGVSAVALAACTTADSGDSSSSTSSSSTSSGDATSGTTTTAVAEGEIPEETNGPYPADGTNGINVLEESGIVRSDITSSLDGGATAEGVPLTFTFTVTDMVNDNAPFEGVAVYVWHCNAQGEYSMYSEGIEDETYLRGIQVTDANGQATFQTIVPACYSGRWPHMHFEVYPDAASATDVSNAIATSQVALPEHVFEVVYALDAYSGSNENLAQIGGIENDNVFGDGADLELGTFTGDANGYVGSLAVAIDTTTEPSLSTAPTTGGADGGSTGGGGGGGQQPSGGGQGSAPGN
ncbi:MAG: 3,4-dioxygenase subunit beta [Protaetiibacter sp.]